MPYPDCPARMVAGASISASRRGAVRGGVHPGQAGEGGAELDASGGQRQPDLLTAERVGVCGQQACDVTAVAAARLGDRMQGCGRTLDPLPGSVGLHDEARDTGRIDRSDGGDLGVSVEQQQLFEP